MRPIDGDAVKHGIAQLRMSPWFNNQLNRSWHHGIVETLEMVEKLVIDREPTVEAEPQWIPVSERLPEESGIYLVTLKTDGVPHFEIEFPNGFVYVSTYEAVTMHWGYGDKNVIAWMPLLKPYHESGTE